MESVTIIKPLSTGLSDQNPTFLKDQNMKKYQHYIDERGEVLPTPHKNNNNCCNLWKQPEQSIVEQMLHSSP